MTLCDFIEMTSDDPYMFFNVCLVALRTSRPPSYVVGSQMMSRIFTEGAHTVIHYQ
jgi:hypothetical protein